MTTVSDPSDYVFDLDAGIGCLDFTNTRTSSGEHLRSYRDLIAFAQQSHLLTQADAEWLQHKASTQPVAAQDVLERALGLRRALRSIFSAVANAQAPDDVEVAGLNLELASSLAHACIEPAPDGGFDWSWSERALERPLWPIAREAAELLTSDDQRQLVRECGASDCAWLFLDTSKNRSRQWCSMSSCGNREKARRHYQRVKAKRHSAEPAAAPATRTRRRAGS
jgi:predicted RNA-binding Zn ribbon-like protein